MDLKCRWKAILFSQNGDDPSEVFAIREYREGDRPVEFIRLSIKRIS